MPASCLDAALSWHFFLLPSADLAQCFSSQPGRVGRFGGFEAEAALLPAWASSGLGPLGTSKASQGMDSHRDAFPQEPAAGLPFLPNRSLRAAGHPGAFAEQHVEGQAGLEQGSGQSPLEHRQRFHSGIAFLLQQGDRLVDLRGPFQLLLFCSAFPLQRTEAGQELQFPRLSSFWV